MSTDIYEGGGLTLTRKAGPASEGEDRARWQFTAPLPEGHATLTRCEATDLCLALAESLGGAGYLVPPLALPGEAIASRNVDVLEREAPHLLEAPPELGPPTLGDRDDAQRLEAAYGAPLEAADHDS